MVQLEVCDLVRNHARILTLYALFAKFLSQTINLFYCSSLVQHNAIISTSKPNTCFGMVGTWNFVGSSQCMEI